MNQIECCPECQASCPRTRHPDHPKSNATTRYRCRDCSHEFDEPDERHIRMAGATSETTDSLKGKLLALDADDALNRGENA